MKAIGVIFLVIVILFSSAACDGYAVLEKYPNYKADYWYCEEIDFAFYYEHDADGRLKPPTGYPLKKEGEVLTVCIGFMGSNWFIDLDNGDNYISQEEQLLSGTWEYQKGNLILTIGKDNVFGGEYKELVFVAGK